MRSSQICMCLGLGFRVFVFLQRFSSHFCVFCFSLDRTDFVLSKLVLLSLVFAV